MFQNIVDRSFTITSIVNNFKCLIEGIYEKGCTKKFNKKKNQNNYFKDDLSQR